MLCYFHATNGKNQSPILAHELNHYPYQIYENIFTVKETSTLLCAHLLISASVHGFKSLKYLNALYCLTIVYIKVLPSSFFAFQCFLMKRFCTTVDVKFVNEIKTIHANSKLVCYKKLIAGGIWNCLLQIWTILSTYINSENSCEWKVIFCQPPNTQVGMSNDKKKLSQRCAKNVMKWFQNCF